MKYLEDNFIQILKFFAFSIFKVLTYEQILSSFMIFEPGFRIMPDWLKTDSISQIFMQYIAQITMQMRRVIYNLLAWLQQRKWETID